MLSFDIYVYFSCDVTSTDSDTYNIISQGYFKVLGKGHLPAIPLVVKAKFFSKEVLRLIS